MSVVDNGAAARADYSTLRRGGLDWECFPLRLFMTGNARFWDPGAIDFSADRLDWVELSDAERTLATYLAAQFCAGEETITRDVAPFQRAMVAEGRFADEMYLAQFCFEKAKHAEVFRLWLDAVGLTEDLNPAVAANPHYRQLLDDELPTAFDALERDPSPTNQVVAAATYHLVIQGTLGAIGHLAWRHIASRYGVLPGMGRLSRLIATDEHRHMAWGTFTCRRHVAADDALWDVVTARMNRLMPIAFGMVEWIGHDDTMLPFGLDSGEFIAHTAHRTQQRLEVISAARGLAVAAVELDDAPLTVEDPPAADNN